MKLYYEQWYTVLMVVKMIKSIKIEDNMSRCILNE